MAKISRNILLIVVAVVVGAALLLYVGDRMARQGDFYGKYASLKVEHDTWADSTHAEAHCSDCHVDPTFVAQYAFRARMAGKFYISLVSTSGKPYKFGTPTDAACMSCHDIVRKVSPKGDLRLPHKAHVKVLKLKCVRCHNFLIHKKTPEGKNTPRMVDCMKCHDGTTATNVCSKCHTKKAVPATHRLVNWTVVHSQQAAKPGAECTKCHKFTNKWCSDCHARRPSTHGKDWRAKHGDRGRTRRNCEACHAKSFCVRCHGQLPALNFNPALKLVVQ
jgi:hypothetical protein